MPPITVDFTPTPDDYARAMRRLYLNTRSYRGTLIFCGLIMLVWLVLLLPLMIYNGFQPEDFLGIFFGLVLPAIMIGNIVLSPWRTGRRVRSDERSLAATRYEFDTEGMSSTDQFTHTRFDWGTLHRVIETPEHYLFVLSINKNMFHFVAKRAFQSPEQENEFRAVVRAHVKKYEDHRKELPGWSKALVLVVIALALVVSVALTVDLLNQRANRNDPQSSPSMAWVIQNEA